MISGTKKTSLEDLCVVFLNRIIPAEVVSVSEIRSAGIWLLSAGHCKNMMDSKFEEVGVAKSGSYWTMVLAAPQ